MPEDSQYKDAHWRIGLYRSLINTMKPEEGIPASHEVLDQAVEFIALVERHGCKEPSVCLGEGNVAVIWIVDDVYISAEFDGTGSYSVMVTQKETFSFHEEGKVSIITPKLFEAFKTYEIMKHG